MFLVDSLQVVKRNIVFSLAVSLLDSLLAGLGITLDVDYTLEIDDIVGSHKVFVELDVDGVLGLVEDLRVVHDAGEDVAIGEEGALGDPGAFPGELAVLYPLVEPAHEGVDLEGEAPPSLVLVVQLQQVDVLLLPDILPVRKRLVEDGQLWEVLPNHLQDRRLPTPNIPLNRNELRLLQHFGGLSNIKITSNCNPPNLTISFHIYLKLPSTNAATLQSIKSLSYLNHNHARSHYFLDPGEGHLMRSKCCFLVQFL